MREWNPYKRDLPRLHNFQLRFGYKGEGDEPLVVDEIIEFMREYNDIGGDQIIGWRLGLTSEDFFDDKMTIIFYTNKNDL